MNRRILQLKRIGARLKRIPHRKGYGVHSPFAFRLITEVISESYPYYGYTDIKKSLNTPRILSTKVLKLIFRLVNWLQPITILEVGSVSILEIPVTKAKKNVQFIHTETLNSSSGTKHLRADLVFIHNKTAETLKETKENLLKLVHSNSLVVISGIGYSKEMKALWDNIQQDERVGITFDLYEVGLVFFDLEMNKQDYKVNF